MRSFHAVLALVLSSTCLASQQSFEVHNEEPPTPITDLSETIVSILSSSTQHTTLIHLLQRSKCIPMLAHIGNGTLFAPTDKAWEEWATSHTPPKPNEGGRRYLEWLGPGGIEEWVQPEEILLRRRVEDGLGEDEAREELDNQNWALRQHLLYHMLNYTLEPTDLLFSESNDITTLTTLLYPLAEEPDHPRVPPPGPPWLPRGGDGMLGGHGQRLRLARAGSEPGGERGKVGGDWRGDGGISLWDGEGWEEEGNVTIQGEGKERRKIKGARWGANGVMIGIEGVLDMPPSIDEIIRTNPALSYLSRLMPDNESLPSPLPANLSKAEHITLFAPSNQAIEAAFDDVEKRYLEGEFGLEGVARVVGSGVVVALGKEGVGWRDHWSKGSENVGAAAGNDLQVEAPPNGSLIVNGTQAETVDIFASNGVIHIMPTLLVPENFTLLNSAEKVLLSLNATRFVSLLRTANLSNLYAGEKATAADQPWTILAPTDDVLDMMDRWGGGVPIPEIMMAEGVTAGKGEDWPPLATLLKYHILPGRLLPDDIKDGMLVGTELRPSSLDGARQRLRVDLSERFDRHRTDWDAVGAGEIRFDGAAVIGKPVRSGKSIIYLISSLLSPPDDVLQVAVADLQLSTFIAAVYAAGLEHTIKNSPATTYFIPRNRAFSSLGLTMRYLLSSDGKDELRKVIKYHAIDKIIYTEDIEEGRETYKTLHGGNIVLDRSGGRKNYTINLQSPKRWEGHDSGDDMPANGEIRGAIVTHTDALTSTGAIHTVDSVVMPADVQISIAKLVRGSSQRTMIDLMVRAGLGWILDGREPNSDELQRAQLTGIVRAWDNDTAPLPDIDSLALPAYTVLCPTDQAFSRINMTQYLEDPEALLDMLKLHIIPTQTSTPRTDKKRVPTFAPPDGSPLSIADDLVFQTLLSASSKYGDVAFRATGDNSYLVGIRNARSGYGNNAARMGQAGRASVRWWKGHDSGLKTELKHGHKGEKEIKGVEGQDDVLWRGGMSIGGGVILVDSVLIPYEPSWFTRWGWLIIGLSGISIVVLATVLSVTWWWMARKNREAEEEGYEPLEGEEEE